MIQLEQDDWLDKFKTIERHLVYWIPSVLLKKNSFANQN